MSENQKNLESEMFERISEDFLNEQTSKITDLDYKKVSVISPNIIEKVKLAVPLRMFLPEIKIMLAIVEAVNKGGIKTSESLNYMVFALLYVFNSGDIIPDYVPAIGYLDDKTVLEKCIQKSRKELDFYGYLV